MDPQVKFENDKLICLKYSHNEKVLMVITDEQVPFSDRFLCSKCMETDQSIYTKVMPISSAMEIIKERIVRQNQQEEFQIQKSLNSVKHFSQTINELQNKIMKLFDEIQKISHQWTAILQNSRKKDDVFSIIEEFQFLNSNDQKKNQQNNIHNNAYLIKLQTIIKQLQGLSDYEKLYSIFKKAMEGENLFQIKEVNQKLQTQKISSQPKLFKKVVIITDQINLNSVKLIQSIQQSGSCAMAFNNTENIMVSGCQNNLKVWKFEKETLTELETLTGHTDWVFCIVFSQKSNWFISGSCDKTIKSWKKNNEKWVLSNTTSKHTHIVMCLIMNKNEDQLISCSWDNTIIVWKVDSQTPIYSYSLEKHNSYVQSISLNDSETALVSCSEDKQIILWVKDSNDKFKYHHHISNDDSGFRICFLDNNQLIWQQHSKGVTHFFQIVNGKLTPKPDFNIELNQDIDDNGLFQTIYNKKKKIIIQKHNSYIYILKRQKDGKLQLACQPIDQGDYTHYGTLSNNGQYLVTWSYGNQQLRVYKLIYK